jgi:glycosyltransferase involved in cell wall biosynthesis
MILTSINRKEELKRLVLSVNSQKNFDLSALQVIFVDQGANEAIFNLLDEKIEKKYIKHTPCSLSKARNIALPYVKNEIICFGDDDAWYDEDTFGRLDDAFEENTDGIIAIVKNEEDKRINIFPKKEQRLTLINHCGALSVSMFLKFDASISFDETIGVGSEYKLLSGEETDYMLEYMEKHPFFNIVYRPDIVVRHPLAKKQNFDSYLLKCYYYARGAGYVLKKHKDKLPFMYIVKCFIRPLIGIFYFSLTNHYRCKKSYFLLKGRIEGYNFKI